MLLLRVLSGWWWDAAVWRGQCQVPRLVALASPFFFWLEAIVPVARPFLIPKTVSIAAKKKRRRNPYT